MRASIIWLYSASTVTAQKKGSVYRIAVRTKNGEKNQLLSTGDGMGRKNAIARAITLEIGSEFSFSRCFRILKEIELLREEVFDEKEKGERFPFAGAPCL